MDYLKNILKLGQFYERRGDPMREISSEIEIYADQSDVWEVLVNFDNWAEWNPSVKEAKGTGTLGSKVNLTMASPEGKKGKAYTVTITTFEAPRSLRWRAVMMAGFLMTNDRSLELISTGGSTRVVNTEHFSGMLVNLFWGKLQSFVPGSLKKMNEALKEKAEQGGRS